MTAPTASAKRRRKRGRTQAERDARRAILADQEERKAEAIAPAAQRKAVTAPNGTVLRGPRLEQDGPAFVRANPIRHLVGRSQKKSDAGEKAVFTRAHLVAAEWLQQCWQDGAEGIGMGASNFGERAGGTPQTGYISDAQISAISYQINCRTACRAVQEYLGPSLWRPIHMVVIRSIDVTAWATQDGIRREIATGYLAAALDRLVEFRAKKTKSPIRSAQVSPSQTSSRATSSDEYA